MSICYNIHTYEHVMCMCLTVDRSPEGIIMRGDTDWDAIHRIRNHKGTEEMPPERGRRGAVEEENCAKIP